MSNIQVRGYMVANAGGYLREAAGPDAARVFEGLSPQTRDAVSGAKPAAWCSVSLMSEICRNVAALGGGNEERARDLLVKCGRFIANEATNTFLKLLMRMLTPTLFAAKLPDFWRRDCTGGKLVVDVSEQKLGVRLHEIDGWDHVCVTTVGYVGFALEAMGKVVEKTTIHDWSLERPNQDGASFELLWKK
jgi:hypothetical protein